MSTSSSEDLLHYRSVIRTMKALRQPPPQPHGGGNLGADATPAARGQVYLVPEHHPPAPASSRAVRNLALGAHAQHNGGAIGTPIEPKPSARAAVRDRTLVFETPMPGNVRASAGGSQMGSIGYSAAAYPYGAATSAYRAASAALPASLQPQTPVSVTLPSATSAGGTTTAGTASTATGYFSSMPFRSLLLDGSASRLPTETVERTLFSGFIDRALRFNPVISGAHCISSISFAFRPVFRPVFLCFILVAQVFPTRATHPFLWVLRRPSPRPPRPTSLCPPLPDRDRDTRAWERVLP